MVLLLFSKGFNFIALLFLDDSSSGISIPTSFLDNNLLIKLLNISSIPSPVLAEVSKNGMSYWLENFSISSFWIFLLSISDLFAANTNSILGLTFFFVSSIQILSVLKDLGFPKSKTNIIPSAPE